MDRLGEVKSELGSAYPVSEKPPVTSSVTGGREVERRRFELLTSSLRTNESPTQTPTNQGVAAPLTDRAHDCALPALDAPSSLARLLTELAALPPEQRAAIAALLAAPTSQPAHPTPTRLDDRLPWEREVGEAKT